MGRSPAAVLGLPFDDMKIAFLFPGQGSQSVGMMNAYAGIAVVRKTFDEASECLGEDLWKLTEQGPADELNRTVNTQPVMLAAGIAVYRAWLAIGGPRVDFVAGHSLGEYAALVAAGALAFEEAVPLVRFRAQIMQDAVPAGTGAMAAVLGLDDDAVRAACAEATRPNEVAEAANLNAPGQVVIAGHRAAVERAIEAAKTRGAKRAMLLAMSVPSHCSLMQSAADKLKTRLEGASIHAPQIQVLQNSSLKSPTTPAEVKEALVRQLCLPVRWAETVKALVSFGVTHLVECGPGRVLAGLNKRIVPDIQSIALSDATAIADAPDTVRASNPTRGAA